MSAQENTEHGGTEVQSKTMWVLGLTFILPIFLTLIAVWIYL